MVRVIRAGRIIGSTTDQYVQLSFTANSVQNGAQMSELEIFGP